MQRRHFLKASVALMSVPMLPRLGFADTPTYTLNAAKGRSPLTGGAKPETPLWLFNGESPGPVLRLPQGKPVHIRVKNDLDEPTSVHWHGIRIDNDMDGVSGFTQDPIMPGETFDYRFTAPDAGTYWYHSHHRSFEQVARGLYGMLIVDEAAPVAVDHDLLFVADDWLLDDESKIVESFGRMHDAAHGGRMGNWLTVNSRTAPEMSVRPGARVRLRCVSTTNARIMQFAFPGLNPSVIAIDGQPVAPTPLSDTLTLAPAQRADLMIDIPVDATSFDIQEISTGEPLTTAKLTVSGDPIRDTPLEAPLTLPANPLASHKLDLGHALNVDLIMEGGAMSRLEGARFKGQMFDMRALVREKGQAWAFNGDAGKPVNPLLSAKRGQTVTVNMINDTRWPHAMHLHGHHFRVVARDDKPVNDAPWRDTELMQAGEKVRIAFVADNPGKWLFHCHMLEHHMAGMGTWLVVA